MAKQASDIADLEKMLEDGEGDGALCQRAIEIVERLEYELRLAQQSNKSIAIQTIIDEQSDFVRVLKAIKSRRHQNVLDAFDQYVTSKKNQGRRT